ncbi:MAG: hypothetical protein Ct9H300mP16_12990 [Pseudomonadota bacterium]|nr:MAG: hypothetical protein Ct9H300mP16_12990 [Pseudomonadota bacterium]
MPGSELNTLGPDYKAFNSRGVLSAAGLQVFWAASAHSARTTLLDAVNAARLGHAVALSFQPVSSSRKSRWMNRTLWMGLPPRRVSSKGQAPAVKAAVELLKDYRKPLIIAGIGAYRAGARDALERSQSSLAHCC